ncbi:MAG: hypothetical protein HY064_06145 [Bacteroidetes bacterium]|nr:hypothetical protein [Bacteroidota bacterium]
MKKTILISICALTLAFGACNSSSSGKTGGDSAKISAFDTAKLTKGSTFYQCTMDPSVVSDQPGKCPKCGMDMTKVEKK